MTLSKKLNGAILGTTIFVLLLMLGLARWSFERGFLDYVNAVEETRLESLAEQLTEYYASEQSWEKLTTAQFGWMMRLSASNSSPLIEDVPALQIEDVDLPPRSDERFARSGPPHRQGPPRRKGPPGGPDDLGMFAPATELLDAQGELVAANGPNRLEGDFIRVPVIVDGVEVGLVQSGPKRRFESPQETAFSRQQWMTSLIAVVFCLALAIFVSLSLTSKILAPVRRMIANVSSLSKGDFSARLEDNRKDEIGQLMRDIDKLAFTLEQNQSARQRWIADISHELRTPMTVLTGELEAIKDGIRPFDHNGLMSIDQEIERLRHLVDDLYQLSLSDIGGLRYRFESLELDDVVAHAFDSVGVRMEQEGLEVDLDMVPHLAISGDMQRLQQLFINLLENSIAYTDKPGQVKVKVFQQNDQALVTIQDTAPTVPLDMCDKLFEPLYRQDSSRQRRSSGAGLGLAICKNIVEAHHGTIVASQSQLGGLQVLVTLPLEASQL